MKQVKIRKSNTNIFQLPFIACLNISFRIHIALNNILNINIDNFLFNESIYDFLK